jgi:hypothetical protein
MADLLPPDALHGVRIGISVSESPDLDRLGLVETHFRLAVAEIARAVLVAGGSLAYGGHLEPDGYTTFMVRELQRYAGRDEPLLVCLAWQEHRKLALAELKRREREYGLIAEVVCLDQAGQPLPDPYADRPEDGVDVGAVDQQIIRTALTAMRRYAVRHTQGRVLLGGKVTGFQGELPGLVEEALLTVEERKPLYIAGGFGGVTVDIIRALGVDNVDWLPPRFPESEEDPRVTRGRELLEGVADQRVDNGLTGEESRRLAASHRPSQIASLIALGLGRVHGDGFPEC